MPAQGMTKGARNEIRKLNATYNNSVAVGLTVAGYWVPAITFVLGSYPTMHKVHEGGWSSLDSRELYTVAAMVSIAAISLISAQNFMHRAARNLHDYED